MNLTNGEGRFTLTHGQNIYFYQLAKGISYTVSEDADGYSASSTGASGTIAAKDCEAVFNNRRHSGDGYGGGDSDSQPDPNPPEPPCILQEAIIGTLCRCQPYLGTG